MKKTFCELQHELFELIRFQDMAQLREELKVRYRVDAFHKLKPEQTAEFVEYLKKAKYIKASRPS